MSAADLAFQLTSAEGFLVQVKVVFRICFLFVCLLYIIYIFTYLY